MDETRKAGVRHDERLLSGRSTAEVVMETKKEIPSTARVYRKEWLWVSRHWSEADALEAFEESFAGRLLPEDVRIDKSPDAGIRPYFLMTRRWTVHAEWKNRDLAEEHIALMLAEDPDQEVKVVDRNSREEHRLISYGVLKLPA